MKKYILLSLILCIVTLSACQSEEVTKQQVDRFNFTDQNGDDFSQSELHGKYWIAGFIFTNCQTVCPPMMKAMTGLEEKMLAENIDSEFVLFSVDPAHDTPTILKNYLQQFTTKTSHWHMLTGYSQAQIETFARESFETIVQKPTTSDQVIHGTNFYLIDPDGFILGEYNYIETNFESEILQEINRQ